MNNVSEVKAVPKLLRHPKIEWYWIVMGLWLVGLVALFGWHLWTGNMPSAAAFSIAGLSVYWYGILIVSGIALGATIVSRLAWQRWRSTFLESVPDSVRGLPITAVFQKETAVSPPQTAVSLQNKLNKRKIHTVGDLLLLWGTDPRSLGLNEAEQTTLKEAVTALPEVDPDWLDDAPWRIWNPEHVWSGIIICLILGLIGARLYHVLTPSPSMAAVGIESPLDYFQNPQLLFNLRNGGLGIYGGLAGGALGLLIFTRRYKLPLLPWADMAVVGVVIGQAFGRWGNFMNQELYGRPTNLPWAITIDPLNRLPAFADFSSFHPAFLYESLWNFLTFGLLIWLWRRRKRLIVGEITAVYLIMYAIGRTLLETVRLDSRFVSLGSVQLPLAWATFVSILVALTMGLWIMIRRWQARRTKIS
ncbi:Prolipoprotein diacylglyceryl transferase [hydrothermal vent metagenome]|uniref:Prolipoprotein diacylglyceryl transferase n=2 Tax=hydrothermal vent metagenome TaxID=652676 RepID=A0A3B0VGK7_9ZZZZ